MSRPILHSLVLDKERQEIIAGFRLRGDDCNDRIHSVRIQPPYGRKQVVYALDLLSDAVYSDYELGAPRKASATVVTVGESHGLQDGDTVYTPTTKLQGLKQLMLRPRRLAACDVSPTSFSLREARLTVGSWFRELFSLFRN